MAWKSSLISDYTDSMSDQRIGIINSGGDCAGLNTVISAVVKLGVARGCSMVGFERGWEGLLDKKYRELNLAAVHGISHLGGTILHTTNRGRFAGKVGDGEGNKIPEEILELAKANCEELGLSGLIVIGGDGTLSAAVQLYQKGIPMVGVPKSIDNDLSGTEMTFGFQTAVDVAVEAIDKIHTTASSHDRIFLVECMGRHSGWISLYAGLAGNANAILLPEFPVDMDSLITFLDQRFRLHGFAIVVVAEGIEFSQAQSEDSEVKLRGASENMMKIIQRRIEGEYELRNVVLGHVQRGGNPNAEDRILAKKYGVAALEAFLEQKYGQMIRLRSGVMETVPIIEATGTLKRVTPEDPAYQVARKLGVWVNG